MIKNIEKSTVLKLSGLVSFQKGQIISRTLAQNDSVSLTLFAFSKGEEISEHTSKGDALISVLEGTAKITIDNKVFFLKADESILMPAGLPHAVEAEEDFKMSLTVIF